MNNSTKSEGHAHVHPIYATHKVEGSTLAELSHRSSANAMDNAGIFT